MNTTVSSNISTGDGGGIQNAVGIVTLMNVTVSGNTASNRGGGIYNTYTGGTVTLTNVTVSANSAASGGGIWNGTRSFPAALINLSNSIVANQTSGADCINDIGGIITSLGYNLDSDGSCNLTATGDLPNATPVLAPLALNAPGTTQTQALLAGSPAIDRIPVGTNGCGTTITTDQRGVKRPQGTACDIGAYEAGPVTTNQCKSGGWRLFTVPTTFKNEGKCLTFVRTGRY